MGVLTLQNDLRLYTIDVGVKKRFHIVKEVLGVFFIQRTLKLFEISKINFFLLNLFDCRIEILKSVLISLKKHLAALNTTLLLDLQFNIYLSSIFVEKPERVMLSENVHGPYQALPTPRVLVSISL